MANSWNEDIPARKFDRASILERLRSTIASGRPILAAGCSAGIIARAAEEGGADLIVCYSTGKTRIQGLPTTPIGHANPITLSMYEEIENVVDNTPIIGGAHAGDPTYRRLHRLVDAFRNTGFDGIINFPTAGSNPHVAAQREHIGQGFQREAAMIKLAREQDYFTMAYAYTEEQARVLAAAGVDVQVPHIGWTIGGDVGRSEAPNLQQTVDFVQRYAEITHAENPDAIILAHGGALAEPEDTRLLYEQTDCKGFVGASSIERIPVENAVRNAVRSFKDFELRSSRKAELSKEIA
jgi:predicted TIM-barrel enzyme